MYPPAYDADRLIVRPRRFIALTYGLLVMALLLSWVIASLPATTSLEFRIIMGPLTLLAAALALASWQVPDTPMVRCGILLFMAALQAFWLTAVAGYLGINAVRVAGWLTGYMALCGAIRLVWGSRQPIVVNHWCLGLLALTFALGSPTSLGIAEAVTLVLLSWICLRVLNRMYLQKYMVQGALSTVEPLFLWPVTLLYLSRTQLYRRH